MVLSQGPLVTSQTSGETEGPKHTQLSQMSDTCDHGAVVAAVLSSLEGAAVVDLRGLNSIGSHDPIYRLYRLKMTDVGSSLALLVPSCARHRFSRLCTPCLHPIEIS